MQKIIKLKKKILLKGTAAMTGVVRGTVFLIKNPSKIPNIKKNVIVVVPFTTPILALLISEAKGLVTDIGGLTCHAAIISREFGIPCIVGAENATKVLKNGQKVILDANSGFIYEAR
jgi:pyruvate,water dikinase